MTFAAAGRALLLAVAAALLVACAEHGSEGLEYRWASTPTWSDAPPVGPSHGDELLIRARVPADLGARPALHIYKPPQLVAADVDGTPIDVSNHWSVHALPPDSAGRWLTVHYRLPYAVREPVISFGSADTLATERSAKTSRRSGSGSRSSSSASRRSLRFCSVRTARGASSVCSRSRWGR